MSNYRIARNAKGEEVLFRLAKNAKGDEKWVKYSSDKAEIDKHKSVKSRTEGLTSDIVSRVGKPGFSRYHPSVFTGTSYEKMMKEYNDSLSTSSKMLLGSGRELNKVSEGTKDLANIVTGDNESRAKRAITQAAEDKEWSSLAEHSPISTTTGAVLPYLLLPTSSLSRAGAAKGVNWAARNSPTLKYIAGETALGALTGAAHYDDTALSGAGWGAGGAMTGKFASDLLTGHPSNLSPRAAEIVKYGQKEGLFTPKSMIDSSRKTASNTKSYENKLRNSYKKQNKLISKEIGGETADFLTPEYTKAQTNRIKRKMDELSEETSGIITDGDVYDIISIAEESRLNRLDQKNPKIVDSITTKIADIGAGGKIDGKAYQDLTQQMHQIKSNQLKSPGGDMELVNTLSNMENSLNDIIGRGLSDSKASEWSEARRQYQLVKAVDRARSETSKKGLSGVEGFVDPVKLAKYNSTNPVVQKLSDFEKLRVSRTSDFGSSSLFDFARRHGSPSGIANLAKSLYPSGKGLIPNSTGLSPYIRGLISRYTMSED